MANQSIADEVFGNFAAVHEPAFLEMDPKAVGFRKNEVVRREDEVE